MRYEHMPKLPGLVSTGEAVRLLGMPRSTFFRWLHTGRIHYQFLDGHYWIAPSTIDALIQRKAALTEAATVRAYHDELAAQAHEKEMTIRLQVRLAEQGEDDA